MNLHTKIAIVVIMIIFPICVFGQKSLSKNIEDLQIEFTQVKSAMIDSFEIYQTKLLKQKVIIASLQKENQKLSKDVEKNAIYKSFYSANIKSLTAIFSILITVAIFIIGFLIPIQVKREFESKYNSLKKEVNSNVENQNVIISETQIEFATLKGAVSNEIDKIEITQLVNDSAHSKAMYFICNDSKKVVGATLWPLRYLKSKIRISQIREVDFDEKAHEDYLYFAHANVKEIENSDANAKSSIDELNELILFIKSNFINDENKKLIDDIQMIFSQKCWNLRDGK